MGHEERFPLPRRVAAIGSVKGPSPEYPVTTGKRRFQPFANRDKIASVAPKRCLALLGSLAATGAQPATKKGRLGGERLLRR